MLTNQKANRSEFPCPFIYLSITLQSTSDILLLLFQIISFHMKILPEKRPKTSLMPQSLLTFCRKKNMASICSTPCMWYSMNHYTYEFYHRILFVYYWQIFMIQIFRTTKRLFMNRFVLFIYSFLFHSAFIEIVLF
jgi:hypothetical protein